MKSAIYGVAFVFMVATTVAMAQTPPYSQPIHPVDPCDRAPPTTPADMEACGSSASLDGNRAAAVKWWLRAAALHSWAADFRLGYAYRDGEGAPRDLVEAYKWFDVAAADRIAALSKEGAAPSRLAAQDNSTEIQYRDEVAKKLTPEQITIAQGRTKEWLASH